ncbi:DUF371 domain-containing protein [Candidatus Bathyarchaeota archaeon]|nr:DUF371 domain-containing protein [Candidatus Bathyarchaeota archaeon]
MRVVEEIQAFGNPNIQATHRTTLAITKDEQLTKRGDCIVAVKASKGALNLTPRFKEIASRDDATITVIMKVNHKEEVLRGQGSSKLTFRHPNDLVIRKSNYVCNRTLCIHSNKGACDLSREFVVALQNPNQMIVITLIAEVNE